MCNNFQFKAPSQDHGCAGRERRGQARAASLMKGLLLWLCQKPRLNVNAGLSVPLSVPASLMRLTPTLLCVKREGGCLRARPCNKTRVGNKSR